MNHHADFELPTEPSKQEAQSRLDEVKASFPNALDVIAMFRGLTDGDAKLTYASEGGNTIGRIDAGESGRYLNADRYMALGKKVVMVDTKGGRK